jgi:anti-sigma B factor antagonist
MSAPASQHYIEWEDAGGVVVIRFTTPYLRDDRIIRVVFEQIDQLLAAGRSKIAMNLGGLEAFASYAIGKLIVLNDKLQPPGARLALYNLSPMVNEIVDIMKLRKRFNIYPTEQAALESFA